MVAETILVPAEMPATPLVLADAQFLVRLASVEAQVARLSVKNPTTAQEAANLLRSLTDAGSGIEKTRTALKKPFLDIGRKIDDVAKLVGDRIEKSKGSLRKQLGDWNVREQARLAEIERQRKAELARLEAQRAAEEKAERERQAALVAATPAVDAMDLEFETTPPAPKTETEKQIEAVKFAPAPVAARPTGVGFRASLRFVVKDVRLLPEQFKITVANEKEIRATYCVGWKDGQPMPVVPGVEFSVDRIATSTGRDQF